MQTVSSRPWIISLHVLQAILFLNISMEEMPFPSLRTTPSGTNLHIEYQKEKIGNLLFSYNYQRHFPVSAAVAIHERQEELFKN
ncbi:MAG: hypothetical protein ACMUIL_13665 [bacterium]